jgi:hypothetical protein
MGKSQKRISKEVAKQYIQLGTIYVSKIKIKDMQWYILGIHI